MAELMEFIEVSADMHFVIFSQLFEAVARLDRTRQYSALLRESLQVLHGGGPKDNRRKELAANMIESRHEMGLWVLVMERWERQRPESIQRIPLLQSCWVQGLATGRRQFCELSSHLAKVLDIDSQFVLFCFIQFLIFFSH